MRRQRSLRCSGECLPTDRCLAQTPEHSATTFEVSDEDAPRYIYAGCFWSSEVDIDLNRVEIAKLCMGHTKQDELNYDTIASDICTNSTLGLRHKYKHKCLYIVQKLCSGPQHCTVTLSPSKRLNEEKKAKGFQALCAVKTDPQPLCEAFSTY